MSLSFQYLLSQCPENLQRRILNLRNVQQRVDHHPEGNVFNHTAIVVSRLIKYRNVNLSWAAIFHDIGKDSTSKINDKGIIQAIGHEDVSAELVNDYRGFISLNADVKIVHEIVQNHMRIKLFDQMKLSKQVAMRSLSSFGLLELFKLADDMHNPIPVPMELEAALMTEGEKRTRVETLNKKLKR